MFCISDGVVGPQPDSFVILRFSPSIGGYSLPPLLQPSSASLYHHYPASLYSLLPYLYATSFPPPPSSHDQRSVRGALIAFYDTSMCTIKAFPPPPRTAPPPTNLIPLILDVGGGGEDDLKRALWSCPSPPSTTFIVQPASLPLPPWLDSRASLYHSLGPHLSTEDLPQLLPPLSSLWQSLRDQLVLNIYSIHHHYDNDHVQSSPPRGEEQESKREEL